MPITTSYWALLVSAAVAMFIGGLWYSPLLFGKFWMKEAGIKESDAKKNAGASMLAGFIFVLVQVYVLSRFLDGAESMKAALETAALVWLGFVATVQVGSVLWEKKSIKLFLLNTSYSLVNLLVMAAILQSWPA